jgi:hypothetical protein
MITTFIDILNETCLNIFQAPFAGLNANTQTHIKNTVNTAARDLCNLHKDWLFLNRVKSIQAWTPDTDANIAINTGTHAPTSKYNLPAVGVGNAVYVGQSKTNTNDFPLQINSIRAYLGFVGLPPTPTNGSILVCPDKNGNPDISNPYGTSDIISLYYASNPSATLMGAGLNNTFIFSVPTAVPKNCTYWIVFKVKNPLVAPANGSASLTISRVSETIDSKTLNPLTSSTWNINTGIGINFTLNIYNAAYTNVLSIGTDIQEVFGFYDNTLRQNRTNALIEIPEKMDSERMNDDTYEVIRNIDGTWTVNFHSVAITPLSWLMEYKIIPVDMVADTDTPAIPKEFRGLIVTKSILKLRAEGRGLNSPDNLQLIAGDYTRELTNMEMLYRPDDMQIEPDINAQGFTPRGLIGARDRRIGRILGRRHG